MDIKFNDRYEILTPDGFCDFNNLTRSVNKLQAIKINGSLIWASKKHIFYINGNPVVVKNLPKKGKIDGVNGKKLKYEKFNRFITNNSYDIVGVNNKNSQFLINKDIVTHNCDELAFVAPNIQDLFWTSISPTLSTGGSCIITSTPNGDSNLFANLWRGAELGVNGFKPTWIKWDEPPGRTERFKKQETAKIGELKWRQEYECCNIDTKVIVQDADNNTLTLTLGELRDLLLSNSISPPQS